MRVTIVGSGTLLPDDRHRSPGHLVEWRDGSLLLDCGSGVLHGLARDGLDWAAISHVAITHFHTDHLGDLPALLWAWTHGVRVPRRSRGARVLLGPTGFRGVLRDLAHAYGEFVLEPGGELRIVELAAGETWEDPACRLRLRTHDTPHTPESIAYRVETEAGGVGYTGDTGPCPPLGAFFRNVDLLISECSSPDAAAREHHLSPSAVGKMAAEAHPGTLVLTHLYPEVEREGLADQLRSEGYEGDVHVAYDGLRIEVSAS